MEKSLKLSKKHGLNPSLGICFYCGESSGEIVLAGRLPGDAEAPRSACWSMNPCPKCAEYMKQGIILISVRDNDEPKEGRPIPKDYQPYRTGGWVVVKEHFITMYLRGEAAQLILEKRYAYVPDTVWDSFLGLPRPLAVSPS